MKDKPLLQVLHQFAKNLSNEPGVYRMLDKSHQVIYVGKAANLKKRVSSYFNKQSQSPKTEALLKHTQQIEVSVTRSETEALLLESSLIKALQPKYNVLLRDDKSYPYIRVTTHPFPRIDIFRSVKKPSKGRFFGPYPSVSAVRETLNTIQKIFKIRNCSDSYFSARSRPCLQYQIKRCTAPCTQYISEEAYQVSINDAIAFLEGKSESIIRQLEQRMKKAVEALSYEEAAVYRDEIKSLRTVQEQQGVVHVRGEADVIAIDIKSGLACVQLVSIRKGEVLASHSFFPKLPVSKDEGEEENLWQQIFSAFLSHYYFNFPERIPKTIITQQKPHDKVLLEQILSDKRQKKCQLIFKASTLKKRWLDFAENNLAITLSKQLLKSSAQSFRYEALQALLTLDKPIQRMECFDISHTFGEAATASCVVFDSQGPLKSAYRQFNMKGIPAGDDYAAMEQAVYRRFKGLLESDKSLPEVLIIDGGLGQTASASKMLTELGIDEVKIIGIAKGPSRKAGLERIILVDESKELSLPQHDPALHLLQQIRDEAHRFAITAHRKKREKRGLSASIETLDGIGSKRRQALLHRFGGLRELSKASIEEIAKVQGISQRLAEKIYQHFHP